MKILTLPQREREREKPGLLKMFYSNGKLIIDDVFESAKNSLGEEKATKSETESDSTRKKKKKMKPKQHRKSSCVFQARTLRVLHRTLWAVVACQLRSCTCCEEGISGQTIGKMDPHPKFSEILQVSAS